MVFRVLVVDDSPFFRKQLAKLLQEDPELIVIDTASDGIEATKKAALLKPDVITMDVSMPLMDGITAVKKIMLENPIPILMLSSLTQKGAKATFDALEAGAIDFLPKSLQEISSDLPQAIKDIQLKVKTVAKSRLFTSVLTPTKAPVPTLSTIRPSRFNAELIIMGTSTGGPVALQTILKELPENFPIPIVLVQHMPGSFTGAYASRLDTLCHVSVSEACDGDALRPGHVLLAPGGKQLTFERMQGKMCVRIMPGNAALNYRPCIDVTFQSASEHFHNNLLGIVLTGMGSDGRDGAQFLKKEGNRIWVQDEASCVVPGMPTSITDAGLADEIINLIAIGPRLAREFG